MGRNLKLSWKRALLPPLPPATKNNGSCGENPNSRATPGAGAGGGGRSAVDEVGAGCADARPGPGGATSTAARPARLPVASITTSPAKCSGSVPR